jgi:hypothetical protein
MESSEEFIQRFLDEAAKLNTLQFETRAPFYQKFFSKEQFEYFFDSFKRREASPEQLVSIETVASEGTCEQKARAITAHLIGKNPRRARYTLCINDGQWEISGIESECWLCNGNGLRGQQKCEQCEGNGWINYARTAT